MLKEISCRAVINRIINSDTQPFYIFRPYPNFSQQLPKLPFQDANRIVPAPHLTDRESFVIYGERFRLFRMLLFVLRLGLVNVFRLGVSIRIGIWYRLAHLSCSLRGIVCERLVC